MGPNRDNVWRESGIVEKFPEGGPKVLWRTPLAGGYAGPAVADGRVFVTDYVTTDDVKSDNADHKELNGQERIQCLDEATGKVLWTHEYPVKYAISYPSGPALHAECRTAIACTHWEPKAIWSASILRMAT